MAPVVGGAPGRAMAKCADQPMFGMWADREEMADPVAYVRKIRERRAGPTQSRQTAVGSNGVPAVALLTYCVTLR